MTRSADGFRLTLRHPVQVAKLPPCQSRCPGNGDVRGWIGLVAQRERLGIGLEEAYRRAWTTLVERNPFPATMGRICPHPCEAGCNRGDKDGAVAVHELERFLGDWALARDLSLPCEPDDGPAESVGVIGAGPAGLSFAYQMARRGHAVTVYEQHAEPGGMLRYGIPEYRLPKRILQAEVQRILDLGVRLVLGAAVGRDATLDTLRVRHGTLFLGIGAQRSRCMSVPGAVGPAVWSGTEYLERVNGGASVDLGRRVVVVGGGNTAIDAARAARRGGAEVTILYRRTRAEMPAIAVEVDDAIAEHVQIEFLAAPVAVLRRDDRVVAVRVQHMTLGDPEPDGRRRPVPIEGATTDVDTDSVIVAISQEPDWSGIEALERIGSDTASPGVGDATQGVIAGGDVLGSGIASLAIAQGRIAAEALHARLRGTAPAIDAPAEPITGARIDLDAHRAAPRAEPPRLQVEARLTQPSDEIVATLDEGAFLDEAARCLSCGLCSGCRQCFMYCNAGGYTLLGEPRPGAYFALALDRCEGCGKCIDLCPTGFLDLLSS